MKYPIELLEHYWNFSEFKPQQEAIIEAVLSNEDCIALLPTGGGKSICFQIPAMLRKGICIVISPLVALMHDQVNNLNSKGIKSMALTSGFSHSDLDRMLDNCIFGNYKFLYFLNESILALSTAVCLELSAGGTHIYITVKLKMDIIIFFKFIYFCLLLTNQRSAKLVLS